MYENLWKPIKTDENRWTPIKTYEKLKSTTKLPSQEYGKITPVPHDGDLLHASRTSQVQHNATDIFSTLLLSFREFPLIYIIHIQPLASPISLPRYWPCTALERIACGRPGCIKTLLRCNICHIRFAAGQFSNSWKCNPKSTKQITSRKYRQIIPTPHEDTLRTPRTSQAQYNATNICVAFVFSFRGFPLYMIHIQLWASPISLVPKYWPPATLGRSTCDGQAVSKHF